MALLSVMPRKSNKSKASKAKEQKLRMRERRLAEEALQQSTDIDKIEGESTENGYPEGENTVHEFAVNKIERNDTVNDLTVNSVVNKRNHTDNELTVNSVVNNTERNHTVNELTVNSVVNKRNHTDNELTVNSVVNYTERNHTVNELTVNSVVNKINHTDNELTVNSVVNNTERNHTVNELTVNSVVNKRNHTDNELTVNSVVNNTERNHTVNELTVNSVVNKRNHTVNELTVNSVVNKRNNTDNELTVNSVVNKRNNTDNELIVYSVVSNTERNNTDNELTVNSDCNDTVTDLTGHTVANTTEQYQTVNELTAPSVDCNIHLVKTNLNNSELSKLKRYSDSINNQLENKQACLGRNNKNYIDNKADKSVDSNLWKGEQKTGMHANIRFENPVVLYDLSRSQVTQEQNNLVIQGSFHQGNTRFGENAGKQCVSNCLSAIVHSKLKPVFAWNKLYLDNILIEGNDIYTSVHGTNNYLCVEDLPEFVDLRNRIIHCHKKRSICAFVHDVDPDFDGVLPLDQALQYALIDSDGCFVTVRATTSLVIKQNNKIYMFDSHARNRFGLIDNYGSSIVFELADIQAVYQHFCNFVQGDQSVPFDVTGITVAIQETVDSSVDMTLQDNMQHIEIQDSVPILGYLDSMHSIEENETNEETLDNLKGGLLKNTKRRVSDLSNDIESDILMDISHNVSDDIESDRLMDISDDMESVDFSKVGSPCTFVRENEVSDIEIMSDCRSNYSFKPLDFYSKRELCGLLNISSKEVKKNMCSSELCNIGHPFETKSIIADGNCLFRAISYAVSHTQVFHKKVRQDIIKHSLSISNHLTSLLENQYGTVEEHISGRKMRENNSWGTALEIIAAADLLKTDIYTFYNGVWIKYSSSQIHTNSEINDRAIYLQHIRDLQHYEVVLSVIPEMHKPLENKGVAMKRKCEQNDLFVSKKHRKQDQQTSGLNNENNSSVKSSQKGIHSDKALNEVQYLSKSEKQKLKYHTDSQSRYKTLSTQREKYSNDDSYKAQKIRKGRDKYQNDYKYKSDIKKASKDKYMADEKHREEKKNESIKKYENNDEYRKKLKEAAIHKYATDDAHKIKVKQASIHKYATDNEHQNKVKHASIHKYATDDEHRKNVKSQTLSKRILSKEEGKDITKVIEKFKKDVCEGPEYICACCFRLCFQNQVMEYKKDLYQKDSVKDVADTCISDKYLHKCLDECEDECKYQGTSRQSLWICYTCHRKIQRGKVPAESFFNNLSLDDVPNELSRLNQLEQHLISLNIPFMKIVALPKGGQKAVHGPCVCVPSDMFKVTTTLPRSEDDNCLVKVKLKRKLQYKGYEEYQFVDTKHLEEALLFLKGKNEWYSNIVINEKWLNPIPLQNNDCCPEVESMDTSTTTNETLNDNLQDRSNTEEQTNEADTYLDDTLQGVQLDTCLQPADIAQEALDALFDKEFNLSPAEENNPVSLLRTKGIEAQTFPVHYPTGKNTLNEEREEKLSLLRYFNLRLMSVENRFARDTSYIFFCQYMSELDRVMSNVQISLRKGSVFSNGKKVTGKMLCDKDTLHGLFRKDEAIKFMKPVRGTPPYWQAEQKNIFAMIRQLGIPTFFASFSSADFRWKEIIETILKQQGDIRKFDELTWDEKCKVLCSNPVTPARMFDRRFKRFLKDVIMSDAQPIGHVIDYFYRVEFQQRGSPHTHCLFWVEDAPKFNEDEDDIVTEFVDKYITCKLPLETEDSELKDIVTTVQQHSKTHSKSCRKKGTVCRFNFPRPPSEKTFISRPPKDDEEECSVADDTDEDVDDDVVEKPKSGISSLEAKKILESLWAVIKDCEKENLTTTELFIRAGVSQEDFQECFRSVTYRNTVVLKRNKNEMFINQYNPHLLKAWDANMDIQYILDAYSCVVYIISYISKSERELGLLLQQTKNEAADGNLNAQHTMKQVGTAYFHFRELSAQEAVFRVIGLSLKECSRKVEFIPVGENPCKMSIPLKELLIKSKSANTKKPSKEIDDDDDIDDGDDIELWMKSITDRYKSRPELELFNQMCLASFCSEFSVLAETQVPNKINEDTTFKLKNDMGYIRKRTRTQPAIIKYARFSIETSPEQYYQSILQLYLPYRLEEQLKPPQFLTYELFYKSGMVRYNQKEVLVKVEQIVNTNMSNFVKSGKELEAAEKKLEENDYQEDAWADLCPETESERRECTEAAKSSTVIEVDSPEFGIPDLNKSNKPEIVSGNGIKTCLLRSEVIPLLRGLNMKQRRIFYKVREWCNLKANGKNPPPFHVFVTGGAGTGKSHLIKCLHYETTRILARCSPSPDDLTVLLTAPTGTAAFNINGLTIHHALSIFKTLTVDKAMLGEDKLNTLRSKLENLQILIIDEVSMVNKRLLFFIHERLRQIKKRPEKDPFGGVSVIAVGDFFQLPPVKCRKTDKLYVDDPSNPLNYLWNDFFTIVELDEVMRQREDGLFAQLLNRLRIKDKYSPLESSDLKMLKQCIGSGTDEALHIYATNNEINIHNTEMVIKLSSEPKLIEAQDFEKNKATGKLRKKTANFSQTDICLPTSILLAEGARVMLKKNEAVNDGLVNGVMGTIVSIAEFLEGSLPNVIFINFDNERVGKNAKIQKTINGKRCVGLEPSTEDIPFKNGTRKQFPLQLAWACTVHKVQGLTVSQAVVDLNKCFTYGQAYVALSRVTTKEGLHILPIDDKTLGKKIYCDPDIIKGIKTMKHYLTENVEASSEETLVTIVYHNIQGLRAHKNDLVANSDCKDADYVCLTETWLESSSDHVHLPNYDFYHQPRSAAYTPTNSVFKNLQAMGHGGVGVYAKTDSEYENCNFTVENLECITFRIPTMNVLVATIYRTQKYQIGIFLKTFVSFINKLTELSNNIIVLGDFNQDILKGERSILDYMTSKGFQQLVEEATTEGGTLIDHVYVKGCSKVEVKGIPTYYSYHDAVSVMLKDGR
ncbi:uncharacterized protein LOC134726488 [Mytilus trossulus]|uniref:uncharacterized protein LOC134726488 n=1 Tax=Mytilus trossulus TaxID=6551 RepID=UPI0030052754